MKIIPTKDYHVHSIFSDGKNTIEENVKRAVELGLSEVGVSEHGFNQLKAGIKREDLGKIKAEIARVQALYPSVKIKLGIEANLLNLNGDVDLTDEDVKQFDFIILGIHKLTYGKKVKGSFSFNLKNMLFKSKKRAKQIAHSYELAFSRYPITIVAHPNYAGKCDIEELIKSCKKHGVLFELNRKHLEDIEPDVDKIVASDVPLIFSSDAHNSEFVGDFSRQIEFVKKYNIDLNRIVNIKVQK